MATGILSACDLCSLVRYDADTGLFHRIVSAGTKAAGSLVGTLDHDGYLRGALRGRSYRLHRLAWLYVHGEWPEHEVDHRDGCKTNNRIGNLRLADRRLNAENTVRPRRHNRLGVLGVAQRNGRFTSRITVAGKTFHLGAFSTMEEARAAYLAAKRGVHLGCTI